MNNEFEKWQEKCKESGNKRNDYFIFFTFFHKNSRKKKER